MWILILMLASIFVMINSPMVFILYLVLTSFTLMAYLYFLKFISTLFFFSVLIIYFGGVMILFGYVSAVIPNDLFFQKPYLFLPLSLLLFFSETHWKITLSNSILPSNFLFYMFSNFLFPLVIFFMFILLMLVSNNSMMSSGPLRAFKY